MTLKPASIAILIAVLCVSGGCATSQKIPGDNQETTDSQAITLESPIQQIALLPYKPTKMITDILKKIKIG